MKYSRQNILLACAPVCPLFARLCHAELFTREKRNREEERVLLSLFLSHTHGVHTRNCLLGLLVTRRTRREHGINVKTPGILLLVSWRFPALLPRFPGIVTLKPVTFSGSNPATRSRALGAALCHATLAKCSSSRATATRIRELLCSRCSLRAAPRPSSRHARRTSKGTHISPRDDA